ncbi:MAG: hypothetical protein HYY40_14330 [Bacteroidetes bacterium]|nr:hypothetical protein [Bacteroidota bacterium]
MINLKQVIQQLDITDAEKITAGLKASNAQKFLSLFSFYRDDGHSDTEIREKLNENPRSFYVLKSRLYDKIQEHLLNTLESPKSDIVKKVTSIPELLLNTSRNKAASILKRLEEQLNEYDMPNELTTVYNALKKITLHTDKYYHYSQLYNRHVAYTLSLDKAEDLMGSFVMRMGEYYHSRDDSALNLFDIIREELMSTCKLYQSHHLTFFQNILNASYSLFLPKITAGKMEESVENILHDCEKIIQEYPKDSLYRYLKNVIYFLFFEYYHSLGITRKEDQYYDVLNASLPQFLYYNYYCMPTKFLLSKMERAVLLGTEVRLYEENNQMFKNFEIDKKDVPNVINYCVYLSLSAFYAREYKTAIKILQGLINDVSFKNFIHAEIEVKLLLVLSNLMGGEYDLAWNVLKNITRKIYEVNKTGEYDNALTFSSLLRVSISGQKSKTIKESLVKHKKRFELANSGTKRMLTWLKMDDAFIDALARPLKLQG